MFELIQGLNHWQICGLATWFLLQGAVFAIIPEEVIMLSMGVLWSQGKVAFPEAFAAIFLGLLPANSAMVFITSRFSRNSLVQKPSIQKALEIMRRKGRWVIFMTRFTPFVRGPVYASVGLSGMRLVDFFKIDLSAAFIQVPGLLLLGAFIGEKTGSITEAYKVIGAGALTLAAAAIAFFLIRERVRRKKLSRATPASV